MHNIITVILFVSWTILLLKTKYTYQLLCCELGLVVAGSLLADLVLVFKVLVLELLTPTDLAGPQVVDVVLHHLGLILTRTLFLAVDLVLQSRNFFALLLHKIYSAFVLRLIQGLHCLLLNLFHSFLVSFCVSSKFRRHQLVEVHLIVLHWLKLRK